MKEKTEDHVLYDLTQKFRSEIILKGCRIATAQSQQ